MKNKTDRVNKRAYYKINKYSVIGVAIMETARNKKLWSIRLSTKPQSLNEINNSFDLMKENRIDLNEWLDKQKFF